jgi:hypothetical protein
MSESRSELAAAMVSSGVKPCLLEYAVAATWNWRRWEDNIKMYLQEVGCGGMDWIKLAEVRDKWWALVNAVMNFWVP